MDNVEVRRVGVLGRIVIPEEFRDRLSMEPGTPITISLEKDKVVVKRLKPVPPKGKRQESEKVVSEMYNEIASGKLSKEDFIRITLG